MAEPDEKAFLGRGWAFPLRLGPNADAEMSAYEQDIREAIRIILGTAPGERMMRPDFGASLDKLVFEPISAATTALARHYVEETLIRWEPRIDVIEVQVTTRAANQLLIDIRYRVRATNTFYNLVYPFYLTEGEPA